jgi:hypothetical protein
MRQGPFTGLHGRLLEFRNNWTKEKSILVLIFFAATVIRAIPGWMNAAWGSDFGIYYGITKDFAENPELFRPYSGWGSLYNYFPVLYVFVAFLHFITGAEIVWLLPRITPIFGGLAVLVFYFAVKEIVSNKTIALLAAAFLAANPFHIYQTSHAAPMTVGHFFLILCLFFFIRKKKTMSSLTALYICSVLLVASHHLTTFFYLITIVFMTFYRNFISDKWTRDLKGDIIYLIYFSSLTFLYWMFIATPIYRDALSSGLLIPSWAVVVLFFVGLFMLFFVAILRRKYVPLGIRKGIIKLAMLPSLLVSLIIISSFVLIFSFFAIPNTGFKFHRLAVVFLVPTTIAVGFALYGMSVIKGEQAKGYVMGWLYPLFISLILTTVTWHASLFPFRHLEYIAYPLAILSAMGAYYYWKSLKKKEGVGDKIPVSKKWLTSRSFEYLVIMIIILSLISAYAVQRTTSGYEESISEEVFDVVFWMKGNITGANFTVASDHRISQILWAEGYNATSDEAYVIWFSENWTDSLVELETVNYSMPQIGYVLIDHVMRFDGIQSNINETPKNMTPESYGKFAHPPFELIYRSESLDGGKWAELYEVDWDYIADNRP